MKKLILGLVSLFIAAQAHAIPLPDGVDRSDMTLNDKIADSVAAYSKDELDAFVAGFTNLKDSPSVNSGFVYTTIDGMTFGINVSGNNQGQPMGDWEFSWSGVVPNTTIDLFMVVKSANTYVGYFFDDVLLAVDPGLYDGTWEVSFKNNGGQFAGLSYIGVFVGDIKGEPRIGEVPEPTTMLLFGTGLIGLAGISRRKRS